MSTSAIYIRHSMIFGDLCEHTHISMILIADLWLSTLTPHWKGFAHIYNGNAASGLYKTISVDTKNIFKNDTN